MRVLQVQAELRRQAEAKQEAEREKRVEHLSQMAAKRMGKKERVEPLTPCPRILWRAPCAAHH